MQFNPLPLPGTGDLALPPVFPPSFPLPAPATKLSPKQGATEEEATAEGAEAAGKGGKEGERKDGPDEAEILLSLSCPQNRGKEGGREEGKEEETASASSTPGGGRKQAREEEGEEEGGREVTLSEKPPAVSSVPEADAASSPVPLQQGSCEKTEEQREGGKEEAMVRPLAGVAVEGGREGEGMEAAAATVAEM